MGPLREPLVTQSTHERFYLVVNRGYVFTQIATVTESLPTKPTSVSCGKEGVTSVQQLTCGIVRIVKSPDIDTRVVRNRAVLIFGGIIFCDRSRSGLPK